MSDLNLLTLGCIVMFIAYAGAYVYVRERFTTGELTRESPREVEVAPEERDAA